MPRYTCITYRCFARIYIPTNSIFGTQWNPTDVPVTDVTCVYKLNEIPICEVRLAPGREARTLLVSPAHIASRLIFQIPIDVYVDVTNTSGDLNKPLAGRQSRHILFRGFITQMQQTRGVSNFTIDLKCIHWLHAMNFSSSLSESSHPGNPMDLTFNAFVRTGAGSRGGLTLLDEVQSFITPGHVMSDLWGNAIFPWFLSLTAIDRINAKAFWPNPINDSPNRLSQKALLSFLRRNPPLKIRQSQDPAWIFMMFEITDTIAGRMSGWMKNTMDVMANMTLWSKLVDELAPTLLFDVVPLPIAANVIPSIPTYKHWWKVLPPDELFFVMFENKNIQQPVRAVGLYGTMNTFTGSGLGMHSGIYDSNIGGLYVSQFLDQGLLIFRKAPEYAAHIFGPSAFVPFVLSNRANAFNTRTGTSLVDPSFANQRRKTILDLFAHYQYTQEILKERNALIGSPLRFDICPGSTIMIGSLGEEYVGGNIATGSAIIGRVSEVTYTISSGDGSIGKAMTQFVLEHVRTMEENKYSDFSVDFHPLYEIPFAGGPMLNQVI